MGSLFVHLLCRGDLVVDVEVVEIVVVGVEVLKIFDEVGDRCG